MYDITYVLGNSKTKCQPIVENLKLAILKGCQIQDLQCINKYSFDEPEIFEVLIN